MMYKTETLDRYAEDRMYGGHGEIGVTQTTGNLRLNLLMEGRKHDGGDEREVKEQHGRLAEHMRPKSPAASKHHSRRQRHSHSDLRDQVEVCAKGSAVAKESARTLLSQPDHTCPCYETG
jgi:hypothetical protein